MSEVRMGQAGGCNLEEVKEQCIDQSTAAWTDMQGTTVINEVSLSHEVNKSDPSIELSSYKADKIQTQTLSSKIRK